MLIVLNVINLYKGTKFYQTPFVVILFCLVFGLLITNKSFAANLTYSKIHSFNKNIPVKLEIIPDYEKKILTCELQEKDASISLYEKKWILSNFETHSQEKKYPLDKSKEIYNNNLEFSVARNFKIVTCEAIAFDGTLFKKMTLSKNFLDLQSWPILSPSIQSYSITNLSKFSLSNFIPKNPNEIYGCQSLSQSLANKIAEQKLCSFLNPKTGSFYPQIDKIDYYDEILVNQPFQILNFSISILKKNFKKLEIPFQIYLTSKNLDERENHKNTNITLAKTFHDISTSLFIQSKDQHNYSCFIPEEFKKNHLIHIYWYLNKELIRYSDNDYNIYIVDTNQDKQLSCVFLGQKESTLVYGAAVHKLLNRQTLKPSWIKKDYLVDLSQLNYKEALYNPHLGEKIAPECQVITEDSKIIMTNVCQKKGNIFYLFISNNNVLALRNYFYHNPPLDRDLLPNFILTVKIKSIYYKTKIYFYVKNYKPVIYMSALIKDSNNDKVCAFAVRDNQNLYLTAGFFTNGFKNSDNVISIFSKNPQPNLDLIPEQLLSKLKKRRINFVYYKFKKFRSFCRLILSNGSTISTHTISGFISKKQFISNLEQINKNTYQEPKNLFNSKKHFNNINFATFSQSPVPSKQIDYVKVNFVVNQEKTMPIPFVSQQDKNTIQFTIPPYSTEPYSDNQDLSSFFSAEIFVNLAEKRLICKIQDTLTNTPKPYHYSIFSNGLLIVNKISQEKMLRVKLNNKNLNNMFTCLVKSSNKIESASYALEDKSRFEKFCYGLKKNNSFFTFPCPQDNFAYNAIVNKNFLKKALLDQFKELEDIKFAKMILWSESQKNKRSIVFP